MKNFSIIFILLLSVFTLSACDVNDSEAEKFGEKIDETAKDIGNDIEDACEDVKESMKAEDPDC